MERMRCSRVVAITILVGMISVSFPTFSDDVMAKTLYVGGSGPGNYTAIQDAIDASSPGDTVYVYNGTYHEHVVVHKAISLLGEDKNTTVVNGSGWGDVVRVTSDFVNISGFTVTDGGFGGSDAGIQVDNSDNCNISNNNANLTNLYGIHLYFADDCVVSNNKASHNWYGITLIGSNHNLVSNNNASDNWGDGIDLQISDGNSIVNNEVSHNTGLGIHVGGIGNFFANNTLIGNLHGIRLGYTKGSTITNNTMVDNGIYIYGYELEHWVTHEIDISNTVNGKPVYFWKNVTMGTVPLGAGQVILANCTDIVVRDQVISNGSMGIALGFSSGNTVTNISALNQSFGIYVSHSENNSVLHNLVKGNRFGIVIYYASNNTVDDNNVSRNEEGIWLGNAIQNTILNNVVSNNDHGASLLTSQANRIYHNSFMNNIQQASDDADTDQWDNGYPSGGNFWSDYTGLDQKSGPLQTWPGSDGIGDSPHDIDVDSQDRYPLMTPIGSGHPRPPSITDAVLSGSGLKNVTITWGLSPDDRAKFNTVTGYGLFRNSSFELLGSGYGLLATLPNGTFRYVDNQSGEGNPNNFFYRVCAIDSNNNTTCAPGQAAKFTRQLSQGLNLVSVPLIQSNRSIDAVLQTLSFDRAWSFDTVIKEWKTFTKSKPYQGDLKSLDHMYGLWISVEEDSNMTVAGIVPQNTTITLTRGWNLIGFPSFKGNFTVGDMKSSFTVERVEEFDVTGYPFHLKLSTDSTILQMGHGYWIKVMADVDWTVQSY